MPEAPPFSVSNVTTIHDILVPMLVLWKFDHMQRCSLKRPTHPVIHDPVRGRPRHARHDMQTSKSPDFNPSALEPLFFLVQQSPQSSSSHQAFKDPTSALHLSLGEPVKRVSGTETKGRMRCRSFGRCRFGTPTIDSRGLRGCGSDA